MQNGLIKHFIRYFIKSKDVNESYEETIKLASIFYTKREVNEFKEFYKNYGGVFVDGFTTAV